MPLVDQYGQNVPYSMLSDKPNAQTLGEGIVSGLTPRSIMRFPSDTVRGAVIVKPTPGMHTYLEDKKVEQYYDGVAWQTIVASKLPWMDVTLKSGYVKWDGGTVAPRVRREGSIVYMEGRMMHTGQTSFGPFHSGEFLATVPAAYRPVDHYSEAIVRLTSGEVGAAEIWPGDDPDTPGGVKVWLPVATKLVGFSASWFVD